MSQIQFVSSVLLSTILCSCVASLKSQDAEKVVQDGAGGFIDSFQEPAGIPWVESRLYEVYIYKGEGGDSVGKLLYFGRHELGDKVNGKIIDEGRPRYVLNYSGSPFNSSTLTVELHPNGALKKAALTECPPPRNTRQF